MAVVLPMLGVGVLFGTMSQRITGMGFALFMAPFFALAFGPYEGVLLINIGGAFSSAVMLSRVWRDVDWYRFWLLLGASIPGALIGAIVVTRLNNSALQIMIGVLLIAGLMTLQLAKPSPERFSVKKGAIVAGLASGFTNGTAGFGAPAIAIYGLLIRWEPRSFAATLQPLFVVISLSAFVIKTVMSGSLPGLDWWIYPAMLLLIVIGQVTGERLSRFVRQDLARRMVIILCYSGAIAAVIDGVYELLIG